jgi:serine protease
VLRDSNDFRLHAVRAFQSIDAFAADLTAAEADALKRSGEVRFITPVVERHASGMGELHTVQNGSPYAASQTLPYGIAMIHTVEVWPLSKGAGPVNVVIFDTGIDRKHPDLAPNFAGGYNTFTQTDDVTDDNGHGTVVAGIIAAADNNFGVVGVAPEARIWSVKVLDQHGFGLDENIVAAIDWVIARKRSQHGDWIMSLSLGSAQNSPIEEEAFRRVLAEGVLAVAAAGNRGFPDVEFPAGYPGVIAVGAVDQTGTLASFSDHGPHLSLVAPGVRVLSTARLGSVPSAGVSVNNGPSLSAVPLTGSSHGEFVGPYIVCGIGRPEDFPASVRGKIALIRRGEITFNQKVRNAQDAGAVSVVIFNHDESDFHFWTLLRPNCDAIEGCDDPTHPWPVVLAISSADGQRLLDDTTRTMDMGFWLDDYGIASGTSMSVPHVSGAAALIWSLAPGAISESVRQAMLSTATDLGAPGFDLDYGYGLINVLDAAVKLAPRRFIPNPGPRPPLVQPQPAPTHP